jgi:hypothetical protein
MRPGGKTPAMAPTPHRIAQTSSEAKKQYKKSGPVLPGRQLKQLERAAELDERAARLRDAQQRRKAADKKRKEREEKQQAARRQTGVGLATQLIGYNHTQAQLKSGMEAFVGLKKRNDEEKRRREDELAKKLHAIAQTVEREPWDDDDDNDDDGADTSFGEHFVDDDLDDDTLLEVHHLVVSDPAVPPAKEDTEFTRLHGPVNKIVESVLDKLPAPPIELLSRDSSLRLPVWDPAPSLLHRLSPLGLPPHRLRIKVGSVLALLHGSDTSSPLSRSQHLRLLRAESERLECLVLDGQLEGTTTFITRVFFRAKYRNDVQYPFQRSQFPVRIATDYKPTLLSQHVLQGRANMHYVSHQAMLSGQHKRPAFPATQTGLQSKKPASFKLPSLPASMSSLPITATDGWDDFLDSGTQIARDLASDVSAPRQAMAASPPMTESLPPLSTQDFDFSMDDFDDAMTSKHESFPVKTVHSSVTVSEPTPYTGARVVQPVSPKTTIAPVQPPRPLPQAPSAKTVSTMRPKLPKKIRQPGPFTTPIDLSLLRPSQRPKTTVGPKLFKRKAPLPHPRDPIALPKRDCIEVARSSPKPKSAALDKSYRGLSDFGLSSQEAAHFFAEDDEMMGFGSPPIIV